MKIFCVRHCSWMPEKAVVPQAHLIRYAAKTQNTLFVLPKMAAFKDPLTQWRIEVGSLGQLTPNVCVAPLL